MFPDRETKRKTRIAIYRIGELIIQGSGKSLEQTVELNELIRENFEWLPPKLIAQWFPVVKARNTEGGVHGRERML